MIDLSVGVTGLDHYLGQDLTVSLENWTDVRPIIGTMRDNVKKVIT